MATVREDVNTDIVIKQKVVTSGIAFQVELSNYYTKEEVDALIPSGFITEIPSEYITESELNEKGYLTEHQSLEGYAKKSDIPDTSNFATKSEIPDTSTFATKEQVEGITDNVYTKTEIDSKFGDIDTILDNINGEVV